MEAMKPRHGSSQLKPFLCETEDQWLLRLMLLLPRTLRADWLCSALWLNFWSCFWRGKNISGSATCANFENMFGFFSMDRKGLSCEKANVSVLLVLRALNDASCNLVLIILEGWGWEWQWDGCVSDVLWRKTLKTLFLYYFFQPAQ